MRITVKDDIAAVHPRGHGEHPIKPNILMALTGSSPWARGTPATAGQGNRFHRFIPVGTGNTPIYKSLTITITVHPRGHGEH